MQSMQELIGNLRQNLLAILSDAFTHRHLNEVVRLCHAFAVVSIRKKLSVGKLNVTLLQLDHHDIAFDCIAELFRMDGEYPLVQLKSYFSGIDFDQNSDQQLTNHLRRLVFSKVNHGIFRLYLEYDSALGKILRNIKLAIQSLGNFVEVERFNETLLIPAFVIEDFQKPVMNSEELLYFLGEIVKTNERIPEVLAKVSKGLKEQEQFAKAVPFVALGIAIRAFFTAEFRDELVAPDSAEEKDVALIIQRACDIIHQKMVKKYVATKKLKQNEFDCIIKTIQQNLAAIVIEKDGQDFSLYHHLKQHLPHVDEKRYRSDYKALVEYLFSLTKKQLAKELKREL